MTTEFKKFEYEKHLEAQRLLYADCFPEAHVAHGAAQDHYDWKFQRLPGSVHSHEFSAWEGSALIGYYAALPYEYVVDGKRSTCGVVCDVMTHASARRKGVFTQLGRFSLTELGDRGVGFVTAYPIRPEGMPAHLKIGWKIAFELPLHIQILSTKSAFKKMKLGILAGLFDLGISAYPRVVGLFGGRQSESDPVRILGLTEFLGLSQYDLFIEEWGASQQNYLIKTREFMKWRLGAPRSDYRVVTTWDQNRMTALAIVRKVEFQGIPCLAILDLMGLPGKPTGIMRSMKSLHEGIRKIARELGADVIVTMMSKHTAGKYRLLRHGYLRGKTGFKLIVKSLDPLLKESVLMDEKAWDLMWIDSDDN